MLITEEVISTLISHGENAQVMQLSVRRIFEDITIEVSINGSEFPFESTLQSNKKFDIEDFGPDAEQMIRSSILRSVVDDLKYRHRSGINYVRITVVRSKKAMLYKTLFAMTLAIIIGIVLRMLAPAAFCDMFSNNILIPIKTMFMNALKMIVAPVVFFSIVSCVGQFGNLSEMSKIGGRIMSLYLVTTVIAAVSGIVIFYLFQPGTPSAAMAGTSADTIAAQQINVSFKDTIVNIVPSNFIKPFLEANMLQLIFLAVICGIAVGMIGKYSKMLSDLFTGCNELFLKITVIFVQFMPLAAFCSILSMILQTGTDALLSVISIFIVLLLGLATMMAVYCIMLIIFRLNPIPFCKKYAPTMLQVFSMASSNAALPLNIDACKKLGVSPKVYSLSLPLGATVNMDGTCIYLSIVSLGLARIYGIDIPTAALFSVFISILVLSVGAPGVPGSGLICLSVLLTQLGVPVEAVGLVMGIDPLVGMLRCMSNCLGDVSVSCMVAKKEGILDIELYKSFY